MKTDRLRVRANIGTELTPLSSAFRPCRCRLARKASARFLAYLVLGGGNPRRWNVDCATRGVPARSRTARGRLQSHSR